MRQCRRIYASVGQCEGLLLLLGSVVLRKKSVRFVVIGVEFRVIITGVANDQASGMDSHGQLRTLALLAGLFKGFFSHQLRVFEDIFRCRDLSLLIQKRGILD